MKMKKSVLSLFIIAALIFSLAACGGGSGPEGKAMSEKEYLKEVGGLNSGASEFMSEMQATLSEKNVGDFLAGMEKVRDTKQAFYDFAEIDNPAEGYEEVHKKLAENSKAFGDLIDEYVDLVEAGVEGDADASAYEKDSNELMNKIDTVLENLGNGIGEAEKIAG